MVASPYHVEVKDMKIKMLVLLFLLVPCVGFAQAEVGAAPTKTRPRKAVDLPEEKETNLGLYVTAKEAYEKWKANPDRVKVLDVRFPEEYVFVGHAEMAWNIPVALISYEPKDETTPCSMKPNPGFVAAVEAWAQPDETILVMCRSGGRGAMAVNILAKAGYQNVFNIIDGMEGDLVDDPESAYFGKRMKNGWKNAGLPWTYDVDPEQMQLPKRQP